jgi:hypothetical protein
MHVPLTPEEREFVLAYASCLEKRGRHWPVVRWLAAGCFVGGIILLVAAFRLASRMQSDFELPSEALKIMEQAGSKTVGSSLTLLASQVKVQVMVLRAQMVFVLNALIAAGVGTAMFVYALSDCTRDKRDPIAAKLLRLLVAAAGEDEVR